jgi:polyhydroxyalkanoate synthase subunit PhaC
VPVDGSPVWLTDIRIPSFTVGTVADRSFPWRSVYKIDLVATDDVTFVLTSGGHNAGIVSEPGHPGRAYQIATRRPEDPYVDPEMWLQETPVRQGSWWPEWQDWLARHSTESVAPPAIAAPEKGYRARRDAPGLYVRQP